MMQPVCQSEAQAALRAAIIGGSLQGTEIAYLAAKAGWKTLLLDRNPRAPARSLVERFVCTAVEDVRDPRRVLAGVDLIVPALEDDAALEWLQAAAGGLGIPLAHDPAAYAVSKSKRASELFFRRCGVPLPASWPGCGLPVIGKPDEGSGSQGVRVFPHREALEAALASAGGQGRWIFQEFLAGPTFSIEIIGNGSEFVPGPVTDLDMDAIYDCKRVRAPSRLPADLQERFRAIAQTLAASLKLRGIMDVEVVLHDGELKVLEIDARFPSQTPAAVYWSSGINLLDALGAATLEQGWRGTLRPPADRAVIYEHIVVGDGSVRVAGEHVMAGAGSLTVRSGFWGADEAITDYRPGVSGWVATMIYVAASGEEAWAKRSRAMERLGQELGLTLVDEPDGAL